MEPLSRTYSWKEAQAAGLHKGYENKDKVTYKNFRKRMLQMRARSWALKDRFSDVLLGIAIKEYDSFDEARDVSQPPKQSLSEKLKQQVVNQAEPAPIFQEEPKFEEQKAQEEEAPQTIEEAKKVVEQATATKPEPPPREKSIMEKMAGQMKVTCLPQYRDMRIREIPEDELFEVLTLTEQQTNLNEDFKLFYSNACVWLGRKMALK